MNVKRSYVISLIIVIVTIALNNYTESIPLHLSFFTEREEKYESEEHSLRILTYNIGLQSRYIATEPDSVSLFIAMLEQYKPDILVLPESRLWSKPRLRSELDKLYSYSISTAYAGKEAYIETFIFSRFPLSNIHTIGRHYIYSAEVCLPHDQQLTLIACHLSSNQHHSSLTGGKGFFENLSQGYKQRQQEVVDICDSLQFCNTPILLCGDLNDFSGSSTLNILQDRLQLHDAWWRGGFGYGATFTGKHLYLRLDHILFSHHLKLQQVSIPNISLSDHRPLIAEFQL